MSAGRDPWTTIDGKVAAGFAAIDWDPDDIGRMFEAAWRQAPAGGPATVLLYPPDGQVSLLTLRAWQAIALEFAAADVSWKFTGQRAELSLHAPRPVTA